MYEAGATRGAHAHRLARRSRTPTTTASTRPIRSTCSPPTRTWRACAASSAPTSLAFLSSNGIYRARRPRPPRRRAAHGSPTIASPANTRPRLPIRAAHTVPRQLSLLAEVWLAISTFVLVPAAPGNRLAKRRGLPARGRQLAVVQTRWRALARSPAMTEIKNLSKTALPSSPAPRAASAAPSRSTRPGRRARHRGRAHHRRRSKSSTTRSAPRRQGDARCTLDISRATRSTSSVPTLFQRWGKLDILVGNAGILGPLSPLHHVTEDAWNEVMEINLSANWRLIRTLDPLLKRSDAGPRGLRHLGRRVRQPPTGGPMPCRRPALEALIKTYAHEVERHAPCASTSSTRARCAPRCAPRPSRARTR